MMTCAIGTLTVKRDLNEEHLREKWYTTMPCAEKWSFKFRFQHERR
jgi:hypothetical protein